MPGGDRTGPMGMGPMTGRRMGLRAGTDHDGPGAGFGRGFRGRGRGGWRHRGAWWQERDEMAETLAKEPAPASQGRRASPDQDLDALKQRANALTSMLEELRNRIARLERTEEVEKP